MKKVFIVIQYAYDNNDYQGQHVYGVYATKALAHSVVNEQIAKNVLGSYPMTFEEYVRYMEMECNYQFTNNDDAEIMYINELYSVRDTLEYHYEISEVEVVGE
jgi:hypothetical protein